MGLNRSAASSGPVREGERAANVASIRGDRLGFTIASVLQDPGGQTGPAERRDAACNDPSRPRSVAFGARRTMFPAAPAAGNIEMLDHRPDSVCEIPGIVEFQ